MDAFTPGMFGELQNYEDRAEFEAWLDSVDGVVPVEVAEVAEMTEEEWDEIDRQEAQKEEDDWWNR